MHIIYMATNKFNGSRYIGATGGDMRKRKRSHVWDAISGRGYCRIFHAAIRKYGEDAFVWTEIAKCECKQSAMAEEIRLISALRPEYNITAGGEGVIGVPRTAEWKERISKAQKGRVISEDQKAKLRAIYRHDSHYKSVVCLNDGKFFVSIKHAAAFYGIKPHSIGEAISGRQHRAGQAGLSFTRSDHPIPLEECARQLAVVMSRVERERQRVATGMRKRSVTCITDNRVYASAAEAARIYGVSSSTITQQCLRGGRTRGGLEFKYSDATSPPVRKMRTAAEVKAGRDAVLAALKRGQARLSKKVICVESGEKFESISAAARRYGAHVASVSDAIHRNGRASGMTFRFAT